MASKVLLPLLLLAAASPAALGAFDVLQMLADKPKYAAFANLLLQTKVGAEVNAMKAAALLVVPDKFVKPLASLPPEKQRQALLNHVLKSYLDPVRLGEIKATPAVLPTLLPTSSVSYDRAPDGQMHVSAVGNPCVAKLTKVVAARPPAICIMEVSEPLLPPGFSTAPCPKSKAGKKPKAGKPPAKLFAWDGTVPTPSEAPGAAP
ncbi:hypothetical protein ACP70R_022102 [Stipagrostis hirtigluma subsp. patula]